MIKRKKAKRNQEVGLSLSTDKKPALTEQELRHAADLRKQIDELKEQFWQVLGIPNSPKNPNDLRL